MSAVRACPRPLTLTGSFAKTANPADKRQLLALPRTPPTSPCSLLQVLGGRRGGWAGQGAEEGGERREEGGRGAEKKLGEGTVTEKWGEPLTGKETAVSEEEKH